MKFLHKLRTIHRKISDWVYLHASAILVLTGLWFAVVCFSAIGCYEIG